MTHTAKVLTVSDGVADGSREDKSGVALVARLEDAGYGIAAHEVTRDGRDEVAGALRTLTADFAGLVVTTGGTGFGPRDLTPEGTRAVIEREAPGLAEAMRHTLGRLYHCLSDPPYNYIVHTAPYDTKVSHFYHWHIEIIPRLSQVAGFEWGSGFYINTVPPEDAARYLRAVVFPAPDAEPTPAV